MPERIALQVDIVPGDVKGVAEAIGKEVQKGVQGIKGIGFTLPRGKSINIGQIADMIGKAVNTALRAVGIGVMVSGILGLLDIAKESSRMLGEVLSLIGRSFLLMVRPFADALAIAIMPFARLFIRLGIIWYRIVFPIMREVGKVIGNVAKFLTGGAKPEERVGRPVAEEARKDFLQDIEEKIRERGEQALTVWDNLTMGFTDMRDRAISFLNYAKQSWENIKSRLEEAKFPFLGALDFGMNLLISGLGDMVDGAYTFIVGLDQILNGDIIGGMTNILKGMVTAGIGAVETIAGLLITLIAAVAGTLEWVRQRAWEIATKIWNIFINFATTLWNNLLHAGQTIVSKIADTISTIIGWIKEKARSVIEGAKKIAETITKPIAGLFGGGAKKRQFGGLVPETGYYLLHAGEYVVPARNVGMERTINFSPTINITVEKGEMVDENRLADIVARRIYEEIRRFDRW